MRCRFALVLGLLLLVVAAAAAQQTPSAAYAAGAAAGAADARAGAPPNARKFDVYVHGDAAYQRDFAAGYAEGYRQPAGAAAAAAEMPAGTLITAILDQPLDVMALREDFPVNFEVATPVLASNGAVLVPAGAWVRGHTGALVRATRQHGTSSMVLGIDALELPRRPPVALIAHVEAVSAARTHVHPEHSQVTGIEYGPRYAALVGAGVGVGLGEAVATHANVRGHLLLGLLGGLFGYAFGSRYERLTPHDPNLLLPIGSRVSIRTDQALALAR